MVMARSAFGLTDVVSVAELLPGLGSFAPIAAATLAVLAIEPVAEPITVPVTENITEPATAMSIVSLSEPVPLEGQAPFTAVHVQVTPVRVAGTTSTTLAPTASEGPALETATV